ncbi:MAG: hypothetical protein M1829_001758 [Trizodia sp. TS-e1964]|nr:MAG: hypothetical protein M1829_001758 [Trizodia sp. TS-e1964]
MPVAPYIPSISVASHPNDEESKLQRWSSLIGIITAIIGNILISFALNIQRYAHIRISREHARKQEILKAERSAISASDRTHIVGARPVRDGLGNGINRGGSLQDFQDTTPPSDENEPLNHSFPSAPGDDHARQTVLKDDKASGDSTRKTYLHSPYWWAGILLMTIGEAGNFLAYGFAPASIVSPLGVVALVSNCVIAPLILKERFRFRDFCGVIIAVAGAVTVVLSAKNSEKKLGPYEIWYAVTRWEFELYVGITIGLIIALAWASRNYGQRTILIDLGLVGLFGGYTALSTKGVASLLSFTFWHVVTFPIFYLLITVLFSTALLQIKYLNQALQRFDSTQVIPTQFVLFTLSVIIGSAILYRDFEKATPERVAKFIAGCLLTFLGVYLITTGRPQNDNEEDFLEDVEEAIRLIEDNHGYQNTTGGHKIHDTEETSSQETPSSANTNRTYTAAMEQLRRNSDSWQDLSDPSTINFASQEPTDSLFGPETPQLRENPWSQDSEDGYFPSPTRPLAPLNSHSTPLPPSESPNLKHHALAPHRGSNSSSAAEDMVTPKRHSLQRLMPGPFLSPLSSSLSAVVAETLRRGTGSSSDRHNGGSQRSNKPSRIKSLFTRGEQAAGDLDSLWKNRDPVAHTEVSSEATPKLANNPPDGRSRSFSTTLGDFLGIARPRDEPPSEDARKHGDE